MVNRAHSSENGINMIKLSNSKKTFQNIPSKYEGIKIKSG
jgi:hypothetical protein